MSEEPSGLAAAAEHRGSVALAQASKPVNSVDALAERAFDVGLGLSVLSWAALRWAQADPASRRAPVQWMVVALHICSGAMILLRHRASKHGTPAAVMAGVPCFVAGLWMMQLAPAPAQWPRFPQLLFILGAGWALAALLTLGRNFAIFPSLRKLVTRGPYSLVRHPAYTGELAMLLACLWARPGLLTAALAAASVPLVVLRILAEERTLAGATGYSSYVRRVRWRMLPLVW
jgi:protein-S-isoprenylcysteine O-methyltransferase Ste14